MTDSPVRSPSSRSRRSKSDSRRSSRSRRRSGGTRASKGASKVDDALFDALWSDLRNLVTGPGAGQEIGVGQLADILWQRDPVLSHVPALLVPVALASPDDLDVVRHAFQQGDPSFLPRGVGLADAAALDDDSGKPSRAEVLAACAGASMLSLLPQAHHMQHLVPCLSQYYASLRELELRDKISNVALALKALAPAWPVLRRVVLSSPHSAVWSEPEAVGAIMSALACMRCLNALELRVDTVSSALVTLASDVLPALPDLVYLALSLRAASSADTLQRLIEPLCHRAASERPLRGLSLELGLSANLLMPCLFSQGLPMLRPLLLLHIVQTAGVSWFPASSQVFLASALPAMQHLCALRIEGVLGAAVKPADVLAVLRALPNPHRFRDLAVYPSILLGTECYAAALDVLLPMHRLSSLLAWSDVSRSSAAQDALLSRGLAAWPRLFTLPIPELRSPARPSDLGAMEQLRELVFTSSLHDQHWFPALGRLTSLVQLCVSIEEYSELQGLAVALRDLQALRTLILMLSDSVPSSWNDANRWLANVVEAMPSRLHTLCIQRFPDNRLILPASTPRRTLVFQGVLTMISPESGFMALHPSRVAATPPLPRLADLSATVVLSDTVLVKQAVRPGVVPPALHPRHLKAMLEPCSACWSAWRRPVDMQMIIRPADLGVGSRAMIEAYLCRRCFLEHAHKLHKSPLEL